MTHGGSEIRIDETGRKRLRVRDAPSLSIHDSALQTFCPVYTTSCPFEAFTNPWFVDLHTVMITQALRLYGLLACLASLVSSTALTYKLAPNERACFFTDVKQQGAKIAFYFAVRPISDQSSRRSL